MRNTYLILTVLLLLAIGCGSNSNASGGKNGDSSEKSGAYSSPGPVAKTDSQTGEGRDIPVAWKLGEAAPVEKVKFGTSDHVEIVGNYRPSAGTSSGKVPGLICVPQLGKTKETYDEFTKHLSEIGIASLAIDVRGHGESTMNGKLRYGSFTPAEWLSCIKDLNAAFGWLSLRPDVDTRHVGFIGASIGANLALIAGARNEVNMIIALSPGLDFHGVKPAEYAGKIHGKPVYVIATAGDKYSADTVSTLSQGMDPKTETKIIDGRSEHGTDMFKIPFFQVELVKWIKEKFDAMVRVELNTDNPVPQGKPRPIYRGAEKDFGKQGGK